MKKMFTIALTCALSAVLLVGCAETSKSTQKTPEELTQLYTEAIQNNGGEMVEYNPVVSEIKEDDASSVLVESLGLSAGDMQAFGISVSMMNVKAYGIAAVMPVEGKEDAVKESLQGFIDRQQQNFEMYLQDQYEVAKNAKLETLEDGTVLMVMCEDQDNVFDAISKAILEG
ncbi:MAG: DUF4358 domain-containing protein [Lawsonibacter sp.]|jgi:hypothetical protein